MSLFDQLVLGVCLLHPVFLSNVLSDVIGVTTTYSANSALFNCQRQLNRACVVSKAKHLGRFLWSTRYMCCFFEIPKWNRLQYLQWHSMVDPLKVTGNGIIQYAKCHFLFVVCSNRVSILYRFRDIQRQRMAWPCKLGKGHSRSLKMAHTIDRTQLLISLLL